MAAARSSLVGTSGNNHPELVCPIPLLEDYFFPLGGGGDNDSGDATGLMEFSDDTEDPRVPKKPDRVPRRQWRGAKNLHSSNVVPTAAQSSTNLIVRRFSRVVDEHELRRVFSPFGEILSAAVMRNIYTGENLGTAFVRFATHDEARAALVNCHGLHLHGCTISVHWARRQHDDTPVGEARRRIFKLFVRNIPLDVTPDDMARVFGCFGPVGGVTLHKDTAGCSCGCEVRRIGFVAFLAEGAAERAASGIHNTRPFPSCQQIPLMVKLAEDAPTHKRRQATDARTASSSRPTSKEVSGACTHEWSSQSDVLAPAAEDATSHGALAGEAAFHQLVTSPSSSSPLPTPRGECMKVSLPTCMVSRKCWCYAHNPYNLHSSRMYLVK